MNKTIVCFFLLALAGICAAQEAPPSLESMARRFGDSLNRIFEYQAKVADLHPALKSVYPVAIVESGQFYIFEPDPTARVYRPVKDFPDTFNMPKGIRAAMPLSVWNNRMACVVSGEAFDTPKGFVLVLHEFVHCYEWDTCEQKLKEKMTIFQAAMKNKDYMWELQYPFPYADQAWAKVYADWLSALERKDDQAAQAWRAKLRTLLSPRDWEYMTWQEWKEGLARCLENRIDGRLGLPANSYGCQPPFDRIAFYCGGQRLIDNLGRTDPKLVDDIEALYGRISGIK
jgi:hypothetical protein